MTVAIVSFNTRELLLRCLDSLADDVRAGRAEVWVVDNASTDGSAGAARDHAPWAQVVDAGANLGFGRAVNLVAERTASEWLLVANADIALGQRALPALLAVGADPHVACVAPRLILPDGTTQHSVHPLPTVPLVLAYNLGLAARSRRVADRLCLEDRWDPNRPRPVPWAIGACLLLRRRAFDAVGRFDEQQWMYAEDLDLAWRLCTHGWITRYEPAATVRHESRAATSGAFGMDDRNRFLGATYALLRRRRGPVRAWTTAAINVGGAGVRAAWMTALGTRSERWRGPAADNRRWLKAHLHAIRDLAGGTTAP